MSHERPLLFDGNGATAAAEPREQPAPMAFLEHAMRRNEVYPEACDLPPSAWVINVNFTMFKLPALEGVVATFSGLLCKYTRFCSIANEDGTWTPVDVQMSHHFVKEAAVDHAAGMTEALEQLILTPLDPLYPLWRVHVVPSTSQDTPSVVTLRVHHCLADGVKLASILQELADLGKNNFREPVAFSGVSIVEQTLQRQRANAGGNCCLRGCKALTKIPDFIRSFCVNLTVGMRRLETDTPFTKSAAERRSGLRFGTRRSIISVPPHSLNYVKALKNAAGVSLNAVQLSVFTGALRRYCDSRGCPAFAATSATGRVCSRASLPVPLPPMQGTTYSAADSMRNNFTVISCSLALGSATPLDRLRETDIVLQRIRESALVPTAAWLEKKLVPMMPLGMRQNEFLQFSANHSVDFSNVPGPKSSVFIGGEIVDGLAVALPNLTPQIIIISYNGMIHATATLDPDTVAEPDSLADAYISELQELGQALGVTEDLFASSTPSGSIDTLGDLPTQMLNEEEAFNDTVRSSSWDFSVPSAGQRVRGDSFASQQSMREVRERGLSEQVDTPSGPQRPQSSTM